MKIKRYNADFGNSTYMNLIDGFYFDMVTNVVEISKEKAEGYFVASVEKAEELYNSLLISTEITGEEKYFLIGEAAEKEVLGNGHIKKLHDKTESPIPYMMFLGACAYYYELKKAEYEIAEENKMTIEYFSTMLPIWLLVKANKFSEMQEKMAKRFLGTHQFKVHTPGMAKEFTVEVLQSKCRIEGEVARWAIKKTFSLEDNPEADQFKSHDTVLVDLGGGTVDLSLLPAGMQAPKNRDALQYIEDIPYLHHLEKLRKDKLVEHFDDVRELEAFIVKNIGKSKMERKDGNSGKSIDLKEPILKSMYEYAKVLNAKLEDAFDAPKDKAYKYAYIGGVAPIIEEAMEKVIEEKYNQQIFEDNHVFLQNARKLNLYGLEILSIQETENTSVTV
ncbi:hypothetical protein AWH56_008535 [Anaerobacillus isosaccharinicus]|uniref:ParM/StbA family protein n=1 Tax=Anaerobacillus isosaccharinicus TaxID=1532552 RepID=A0A1S2L0X2_9BACI|nr:ParM/StbA family protein [Anaerobacillus isosaccharinicus]MBA5583969.1 ParM/StbA family protein [Anaerobacillus isosaccharinicus]QOY37613.1 ParM/StbA family protein [Anaerobacillus isosaccharinicus]